MLSSLSKINRRQKAEYYLVQRMHWKTSHTFLPPNPDTGKLFRSRIHSIFRILSKYQKRVYFTVNLSAFSISVVLSFSRSSLLILLHFFRQLSSPHAQQIFFTCSTSMHIVSNTIDVNRFYAVFFSLPFRKYPLFRFPPKKKKTIFHLLHYVLLFSADEAVFFSSVYSKFEARFWFTPSHSLQNR